MHDTLKHTTGTLLAFAGAGGGITLSRVNEYGSCACWMIGIIAGCCTIHSWWENRRKRKGKK